MYFKYINKRKEIIKNNLLIHVECINKRKENIKKQFINALTNIIKILNNSSSIYS